MDKPSNKAPPKTKDKSNKSIITNDDEMIENPNILRIPLRPTSARNQHDENINENRLVKYHQNLSKRISFNYFVCDFLPPSLPKPLLSIF